MHGSVSGSTFSEEDTMKEEVSVSCKNTFTKDLRQNVTYHICNAYY